MGWGPERVASGSTLPLSLCRSDDSGSPNCLAAVLIGTPVCQSEHIGQWATPHHHDRRLGGNGRVVPIAQSATLSP